MMMKPPASTSKLPSAKQAQLVEKNARPKGFPSGSKRLQPIKAGELRNSDLATSPMNQGTKDINMLQMRMT